MYTCNITGVKFDLRDEDKTREGGRLAPDSQSFCRWRAISYALTKELYGEARCLKDVPRDKSIRGLGMSQPCPMLEEKYDYTNVKYHEEPLLDIHNDSHVRHYSGADFVISSDVFEHISPYPSLQHGFDNLHNLLRPGGFIVFTVPYNVAPAEHVEHFPNLYDYTIEKVDGEDILHNRTVTGVQETFRDLVFHGGPGTTLEMRVFTERSVTEHLRKAGFVNITIHRDWESMNKFGIFWSKDNDQDWSLVITARRRASRGKRTTTRHS